MKFRCLILFALVLFFGLFSCKKETQAPIDSKTAIVGKWQITRHSYVLSERGVQVGQSNDTTFTAHDYIQYFNDGSGISSANTGSSFGVNEFTYTVNGTALLFFRNVGDKGQPETITRLTTTNFSFHYEINVQDPATGATGLEVDDFDLIKVD